ncbi:MAG: ABC transporter permease [Alicyclobacillus sp.]|nr:ABC transporter permease [Alicyclobacillus sp.]
MTSAIQEMFQYRAMIKYLVRADLRGRYKGSVLGFLWTFINPLMLVVIYTVIFSTILKVNIHDYTVYLLAGLLPWTMFQSTVVSSASVIIRNSNLVKKIYFPRQVLPLSVVFSNTVNYLYSMVIMLLAMLVFRAPFTLKLITFPVILFLQVAVMCGFALFFSAVNVYYRDVEHILTVLMTGWFYVTPVLYTLSIIPASDRSWFYLNPMTCFVQGYVNILYYGKWPNAFDILAGVGWAIFALVLGWCTFSKLSCGFGEEV